MKKILLVVDSLRIGGAERAVINLANGFLKKGFKVDIIAIDNIIEFSPPKEVNLHSIDFKKSFLDYFRYSKKLHRLIVKLEKLDNKEFDLILVNLQKSTRLMKSFNHKKIYHVIRNTLSKSGSKNRKGLNVFFRKQKLKKIYNNLELITLADGIKNDMLNKIGVKPKSIQTINNSINIDFVKEQACKSSLLNIGFSDYIIHVGSFSKQKRHDVLLRAFALLDIDVKLLLVGDGSERKSIESLIEKLNIKDKVILTGFQNNPYPYIKNARLLVLSSDYEGMPNVLIESLALNTPVVSTDCPSGPNEILTGELSKYLVEVGDINELSNLMKSVYLNTYTIDENLLKKFFLENIINKYISLLEE